MKRLTVTVDEGLFDAVKHEVALGRAASVSAWVVEALRQRLLARAELFAELERMAAEQAYSTETMNWVAEALGRPVDWVADKLGVGSAEQRQAG